MRSLLLAAAACAAAAAAMGCRGRARDPAPGPTTAAPATPADAGRAPPAAQAGARRKPPLLLADFAPRSMLHAAAHDVPRARFAAIDFHQHVDDHVDKDGTLSFPPAKLVALMDAANVRTLVILTGPRGADLSALAAALAPYPGRFVLFTQVDWARAGEPGFAAREAAALADSVARGARGLKVLKDLGLYHRDAAGRLLAIDDPRFDPIWHAAGELRIPVAIHSGDPEAFFLPADASNERYDELQAHPEWSFAAPGTPPLRELLAARDRVIARHPETTFVALHVGGWPENLDYASELLARHPNAYVELGAREAELGRQPRRARRFFLENADRIMFGTDFWPSAAMYANHFRWLETDDEYFPYHGYPDQGRWYIYGLGLPEAVLRKIYRDNAERILDRSPARPRSRTSSTAM
jgi:predicted TIM-barrel fold metal-dependent hydrolase